MEKLVLIDGNSLVNRAYYALPPLNNANGEQVQAVYGFATMLIKAIADIKPDYIAVAFDLRAPTFRHKMSADYKATRKGMPDELAAQMPILKRMLGIMGIKMLESEGFEADDIIGTMAKRNQVMTYIITGDRDSLQLIDDTTTVLLTRKGLSDIHTVDAVELESEYGLEPYQVIEFKALAGDSSDNISGVAGVGEKTAMNLLKEFGNVDSIYANLDKITNSVRNKLIAGKDSAYMSQALATIKTDMNLPCELEECRYVFPFSSDVKDFFEEMQFKSLLKRADIFGYIEQLKPQAKKATVSVKIVNSLDELSRILGACGDKIAFALGENLNFAFDSEREYLINLSYSLIDDGLNIVDVMQLFRPIFESANVTKVVYDAKFIKHQFKADYKINFTRFFDVKLAQYLVDMTINYSSLLDMIKEYALDESEIATGLLYIQSELEAELESLKMHRLYYDVELPLVDVLFDMEDAGFHIDISKLNELGEKYVAQLSVLESQIFLEAGKSFNIKSPKQLAQVLFEDMKIPYPKKTTAYSTSADILEQIEYGNPIVSLVLKYRFLAKLNGTYVEGLRKLVDSRGMVHTEFKQTLTTTGRLSSVEPNLQNIPVREEEGRALREMFVASEGCTLLSADYSQIELRLMAHMSGDPIMTKAYLNNEDIHTSTASEVFGVPKKEVTSKMRRDAKAVNFGIIYGISEYGLAANLKISRAKAKEYIDKYFEKFGSIKQYLQDCVENAKKTGSVSTLLGRVRKIPELLSSVYMTRQFGERAAMNMPLQGTAADIIKIAMLGVDRALIGKKSKLILQIHDELIVDTSLDEVDEVRAILKSCMENAVTLSVPLTVEIGEGKNWLACK